MLAFLLCLILADDTADLTAENATCACLRLDPMHVYELNDFTPLAGTTIDARGATINLAPGALSCVKVSNEGVTIEGGRWRDTFVNEDGTLHEPMGTPWSCAFRTAGGANLTIRDADVSRFWGAVVGSELEGPLSKNVQLVNCRFHRNWHGDYLSDIDGLLISGCTYENNNRDGIRLFRSVRNFRIVGNLLRFNGDGDPVQSQDGIDLFTAGENGLIANNQIVGNRVKGVDIKRSAPGSGEVYQDRRLLITGNLIEGNYSHGIQVEVSGGVGYVDDVQITSNQIRSNKGRGIYLGYAQNSVIAQNHVSQNLQDGIRTDNGKNVQIQGNTVLGNGGAAGVGINVVSGSGTVVEGNTVAPLGTLPTVFQLNGILSTNGIVRNNFSSGHIREDGTGVNVQGSGSVLGKSFLIPLGNRTFPVSMPCNVVKITKWQDAAASGPADLVLKKKSLTGALSPLAQLLANDVVGQTVVVPFNGNAKSRAFPAGEQIQVTANGLTSGFLEVHYID